jgi:protein-S-isoprenylcysteine O-methyltransferase Ste14/putative flippase GtrA
LVRFAGVGASGIVVNQLLFWLWVGVAHRHYVLGAVVATQGSTFWNFGLTERWVFPGAGVRRLGARLWWFLVVNNSTLLLRVPLLALLLSVLGINYLVSNSNVTSRRRSTTSPPCRDPHQRREHYLAAAATSTRHGWPCSLDRGPVRAAGAVLAILGIAVTLAAQLAMGASWRADVDPDARTALVTTGPFRVVRNPIFTATAATGLALLIPNLLAVAMLVAFVTALQVQVRLVEEPYLHRVHGILWERYAARTGRFLPWIGRYRAGAG